MNTLDRFIANFGLHLLIYMMTTFRVGLDELDETLQLFRQSVHRSLAFLLILFDCLVKVLTNLLELFVLEDVLSEVAVHIIKVELLLLKRRLNTFFDHSLDHLVFRGTMASLFVSMWSMLLKMCHHRLLG